MGSFLFDILEFVMLLLFLKAMFRSLGSLFRSSGIHGRTSAGRPPQPATAEQHRGETARDPVCGMFVSTEVSQRLVRGKETMHFCSRACLEKFQKEDAHVAT